ncbi:hypothetical protein ENBRE01_0294 [Enteropsectra breve]|nr:hypothetical protein ENBRE01_0294 [Enteropsectra breve]
MYPFALLNLIAKLEVAKCSEVVGQAAQDIKDIGEAAYEEVTGAEGEEEKRKEVFDIKHFQKMLQQMMEQNNCKDSQCTKSHHDMDFSDVSDSKVAEEFTENAQDIIDAGAENAQEIIDAGAEKFEDIKENVQEAAEKVEEKTSNLTDKAAEMLETGKQKASEFTDKVGEKVSGVAEAAKKVVGKTKEAAERVAEVL